MRFAFCRYRRPFRQPLRTRYGLWSIREGILVRLTDAETGGQGYGEIAPIPWLGSETVEEALAFCQQLPPELSEAEIEKIPATLPATRFGLECAWLACRDPGWLARDLSGLSWCGLFGKTPPSGSYPAYKVKVGVEPLEQEVKKLESWLEQLPAGSCLRLDANGGLSLEGARRWLALCDRINQEWPGKIEFFEQPLPPAQHADLSRLSWEFQTPIALDESVVGLEQLQAVHQAGWKGILVVKPSLVGSCLALRDYLRQHPSLDLAFSSALETPIGAWHGLVWAGSLQAKTAHPRALGWGVGEFFQEGDPLTLITLSAQERAALMQAVWERHSQP
ncbi:o-succinylbenzoate synthase [Thermostichus sp. MS-CIW-19]|jgi:O-succinylbenzoate synthase|uniref:o-succinylbenzoate synthase n=1 Tax=unclassified Synechococcus TaxID=2626047 RepID=UPI0000694353|nr:MULTISPECIES: o-succinylbenzoate synthase [unclassified Synechococcus]ABC99431.1 O-succinylbenzoate synthetase [Synechococcus sp. JA-3-3Ab]PIK85249.1 O-succinylbenzoate synthase [Synechococcus sp. 63AY4M2]PIK88502.1 O-succinylbenzoate synthase [Synechococcus sp. 65AY6A5]PIK92933.1 O-succinylbenzoate synthase [Synechococcus sp. 65AY6Li]PIK94291.1 O-succinylbenzoate synthase [Synechococcus sp. 60AY4M2]